MTSQDIAIVGMSAMFAGSKDLQTYWQNIINKVNGVQDAPDAWATPYYDPKSTAPNRIYTRKGGFIGDLVEFEPTEFGIMPKSIEGSDPVHFIALKLARDALADADYIVRHFNREKTGIILGGSLPLNRGWGTVMQQGMVLDQTLELLGEMVPGIDDQIIGKIENNLKTSVPDISVETIAGLAPNIITGRIANRLDLKGPNYVIDGACGSSLIAMDLAIKELTSGRCDMMLTGGVNATISPQTTMGFCQLGALSRSEIRPFAAEGNGTLLGEGLGILVLKRLSDAAADGDRIYAVIKGVGISSDGKALGLLAPRLEGEVLALERAYAQSGVDPKTVSLIEAHGTGIPLGDRTEMQALNTVFGQREEMLPTCALGSVKSEIGHCLLAAGAASTIKTALALYHKVLPPTLCDRVNPELHMEESCFYINNQTRPWIHRRREIPRRAGVNAFGFGGINAHVVLEEYRGSKEKSPPVVQIGVPGNSAQNQWPTELCVFGAALREELIDKLKRVRGFLQANGQVNLADLAYTLSRDITGGERMAIVAKDIPDLQAKLDKVLEKLAQVECRQLKTRNGIYYAANSELARREKTAFLFPGEGSQYQNMLADLCLYFPQVRSWFDFLDRIFGERRSILPSSIIFPPPTGLTAAQRDRATEQLFQMDWGSEAVFTANMALYELLRQLGIDAEVMVGHSTGENTALIASETIKIKDREDLGEKIFALNQIYEKLTADDRIPKGSQLAVGAVELDLVKEVIAKFGLHLAMENCPNQVIVFGEPEAIAAAGKQLEQAGGICRPLPFDRAYHTPLFAEVSAAFKEYYDTMEVGPGHTSIYSCTSNQYFPEDPEAIRIIVAKQWFSQVRFTEAISALYDRGIRTFVEVGPSSNLTGFVNDILREGDKLALASNIKRRSGLEQLQHVIGCLYANGATVNFETFYKGRELQLLTLGDRPAGEEKPKGNRLELKMPIMRLQPEFVREIKAQLQSNLSTVEGKRVPEQISDGQEAVPTDNGSNGSKIMPVPTPEREILPRNGVATPAVGPLPEDTRLAIVQSHFDLMEEFLANQERVTAAVFQDGIFSPPTM
ncbi:MAG: type I polyketide synthase [Hormoscilla sp.]